jgi:hypothetical protein
MMQFLPGHTTAKSGESVSASPGYSTCNCDETHTVMKAIIHHARQRFTGAIGYILLWLMGVPAILLFAIFLLRGCD